MEISRRTFIQSTVAGGAALTAFGFDVTPVYAQAKTLKIARTSETRTSTDFAMDLLRGRYSGQPQTQPATRYQRYCHDRVELHPCPRRSRSYSLAKVWPMMRRK